MNIPEIESIENAELGQQLDAAINNKTKPLGSLGALEVLARQIGLIRRSTEPVLTNPTIMVFAADHGVVAENISAYPQSVTWQMVENFLQGGAAINVFARQNNCQIKVVDAGVNHSFAPREALVDRKVGFGTRNFAVEAAMTTAECHAAIKHGMELIDGINSNIIGFGEMGIGNTTAAAALMHKLSGIPVEECVGAGTGLTSEGVLHKQHVIEKAVKHHHNVTAPLEVLATFGGFEIAMMVGAMLRAAELRKVLLIDGFIVTSAAMVAIRLQPALRDYCVFSHCSDESGHWRMLRFLDARPLLQLGLRLGEGTGSALALPIVQAAVNFLTQMATFQSASVSEKIEGS